MKDPYTKFLFFTGKGGVGKTSLACATAVRLADLGQKVLLISTDPASNLADVLDSPVTALLQPHKDLANLFTINIDPEVAADEYRGRVVKPLQGVLASDQIIQITEGLSGACTTEIASFDEFSRFITGEGAAEDYDTVIFDTAPTGHTLRLLELPAAWDNFLELNPSGVTCIGPSSALKSSKQRYQSVVDCLRDPAQTTYFLVSRPDKASLKEAAKTSLELIELGMVNQKLLVNGVFTPLDATDPFALKMQQIAAKELAAMPAALRGLETQSYPLLPYNVLGLEKLRSLLDPDLQRKIVEADIAYSAEITHAMAGIHALADALEGNGKTGLIMTMGKGGVGKTIVAAAIATILARRGHQVLLTTTDPAAHIDDFISQLDAIPPTLTVDRIDPKLETQRYIDKVFAQKGANLDDEAKELLREDLQSPCTEEVAVFHAFSKAINSARRQFVVMDTAPTGHTLLLLDTAGSYHREVTKHLTEVSGKVTTPWMKLQDGNFAKILLVALPETTPMREAEALQNDLLRAGITPYAWVINQCLSAVNGLQDPLLRRRASAEGAIVRQIEEKLAQRVFGIPYLTDEKMLLGVLGLGDARVIETAHP